MTHLKFLAVIIFCWGAASNTAANTAEVKKLFERSCYGCHGKPPYRPEAGLNILEVKAMRDTGLITPGSPDFSLPYIYIEGGRMPPEGANFPDGTKPQRLSNIELEKVKQWILDGAEDFAPDTGPYTPPYSYEEQLRLIRKDLDTMPRELRPNVRYFSFAHIAFHEFESANEKVLLQALEKAINSLSTAPSLRRLNAVDGKKLLFRMDLSDFRWTRSTWNFVERVNPFRSSLSKDSTVKQLERSINTEIGVESPYVRADWFVRDMLSASNYHNILYLDQFGLAGESNALKRLEDFLGIDRLFNISNGKILRAGFTNSGVSQNNRLIERHNIASYAGSYWLSYDFASNSQDPSLRHNLFSFPLGPQEAYPNDSRAFLHAGGEAIFSLPNGLHAYLLVDTQGQRLNKAPTSIVADPSRPDHAVENGISCFRCHEHGIILKNDTISDFVQANGDLYQDLIPVLRELYPDRDQVAKAQRDDLQRYLNAIKIFDLSPRDPEPITLARSYFEQDVSLDRLAAELAISADKLRRLIAGNNNLRALVGPLLVAEGRVKREVIVASFATLTDKL